MKKSNFILQAAVASALVVMVGGAQAGTTSGANTTFATELFGATSSATNVQIKPGALVYTFNTPGGIVVNAGGSVFLYQRLAGGIFSTLPLVGQYALSAGVTLTATAVALSTDSTTVRITLNNGTTVNQTIGIGGAVTWTPIANAVGGVNVTLATAGGAVSASSTVSSIGTALPNTGIALPSDLDNVTITNTGAGTQVAVSATAITGAIAASSSFAKVETQQIDLTAASPTSRFTTPGTALSNVNSATLVNLGSVTFTETAGNQFIADASADYTIAGRGTATTFNGTVTGAFKTGATAILTTDLACTTGIVAGSLGVLNAGLTQFTFSAGTLPTAATPNFICLTAPVTAGAIPETTPTASFTFTKTTTTDAATTAAGTLYALKQNGATVDVRSYIPASTAGYTSFVRIINTGSVAAAVMGQWVFENGTTSTAATLIASHPGAGSVTLSSTQIEAALGAPTVIGGNRPRLRLTAPTNGLQAQSFFLTNANGNFSDATGAQ